MRLSTEEISYFDFDIEIDNEEDDYKLLLDLPLRNNLKVREAGKAFNEISYLGQKKFKIIEGKKCLLMEPMSIVRENSLTTSKYKTQNNIGKPNLISIPSYGNIKTRSGKLCIEISPLNITNKQYIFIHNEIQYPSTTIAIWIEDGRVYRHDIKGIQELDIDLVLNKWNELDIDFAGSFYTAERFYISDIQQGIHAYIRNFRVFKR